jgi:hypothetical protein
MTIDHRALPLRTSQNPELYDGSYFGFHELKLNVNIIGSSAYPIIPIPASAQGFNAETTFTVEIKSVCTMAKIKPPKVSFKQKYLHYIN